MRARTMVVLLGTLLALAVWLVQCSNAPTPSRPHESASPARLTRHAATPLIPPQPADKWLAFQINTDGTVTPKMPPPPNENSRWKNPAKRVEPVFPATFDAPVRVKSGVADVSARPLNANNSSAEIAADGSLIYRDAFPGCDVQYRCTEFKTEEFIIVNQSAIPNPQSAMEFAWSLDTRGLKPRLTPAHSIELCDEQGVPRLRINPPDGKDADGKRLEPGKHLQFALNGEGVTLRAELAGFKAPIVIDPTWSSTGTMSVTRQLHAASLLSNGKVLVTGGLGLSSERLTVSEIFDPLTETWSVTASLTTARHLHTSTLLPNGLVLVAGGFPTGMATTSAELFDPAGNGGLGNWSAAASMTTARGAHTATLLSNNRVLVVSGSGGISNVIGTEIYNPLNDIWTTGPDIAVGRSYHIAALLPDGRVLVAGGSVGGGGSTPFSSAEVFDPSANGGTGGWTSTASMTVPRQQFAVTTFNSGRVLVSGGLIDTTDTLTNSTEIFDVLANAGLGGWVDAANMSIGRFGHTLTALNDGIAVAVGSSPIVDVFNAAAVGGSGSWNVTQNTNVGHNYHTATLLQDGRVLIAAGGTNQSELFNPNPHAESDTYTIHSGKSVNVILRSDSLLGTTPMYQVVASPLSGSLNGTPPNLTYTASSVFVGSDQFTYRTTDEFSSSNIGTITINVTNTAPVAAATASPAAIPAGGSTQLTCTASDPEGDTLSFSWDFGDGSPASSEQNPAHTYSAPGDYTATVTVTDSIGASTTASVNVHVGRAPKARFTTSDIVGFVGQPLLFDASFSTDPENAIASYAWNFGDGSPVGAEKQISRIYTAEGSYTVTLTVTDAEGLSASLSRQIEVLPADQVGLFNSFITYKVKWDRNKTNADSLSFDANVNVGADTVVGKDTLVAVEVAGKRFEGTLDKKLRDKSGNESWQVIANSKKQSPGEVRLKLSVKKTSLGLEFNQAGAVAGADLSDEVTVAIPVRIEIAGRAFDVLIDSEFKFGKDGKKASGSGEGP